MRYKIAFSLILLSTLLLTAAEQFHAQQPQFGRIITVKDIGDSNDVLLGDGVCADSVGKCTLRAAIDEANSTPARDAIIFDVPLPAVIALTLGELKTTNPLRIFGRGPRQLTIERAANASRFRVFNFAAPTYLYSVTVRNGDTLGNGGGILSTGYAFLSDVSITGNRANAGGGIAIQAKGFSARIDRCLINSNIAVGQGGGIYVIPSSSIIMISSTFTGNSALEGGGISNYGIMTAANNTITRNAATQIASGFLNGAGARAELVNTIIGLDRNQSATLVEGSFLSAGGNIVTNTTGSSGWSGRGDQISTNNGIDPMLGELMDNGGQIDSLALLPGSPAIDNGDRCVNNAATGCGSGIKFDRVYDQRKFEVRGIAVDIGAYEVGAGPNTRTIETDFSFGASVQLAFSRVAVINPETLETRFVFLMLFPGGVRTPRVSFQDGGTYIIEPQIKRLGASRNPLLCTFGADGCTSL